MHRYVIASELQQSSSHAIYCVRSDLQYHDNLTLRAHLLHNLSLSVRTFQTFYVKISTMLKDPRWRAEAGSKF